MRRIILIDHVLARLFLLPADPCGTALGPAKHPDLVRMLINSLSCPVLGVLIMVLAI
jgi:hypothetical protein